MIRIAVLYEDQLATSKPRAFGPHVLLLALDPITDKPSPLKRDGILLRLAFHGAPDQRRALLQRVPSFAYLVDRLTGAILELGL